MHWNLFIAVLICLSCPQRIKCKSDFSESEGPGESDDESAGIENDVSSSGEIDNSFPQPTDMLTTHIQEQAIAGLCKTMYGHVIAEIQLINRTLYTLSQKDDHRDPTGLETCIEKDLIITNRGQEFNFSINIKGCVSESDSSKVRLKYRDLNGGKCDAICEDDLKTRIDCYLKTIGQISDQLSENCPRLDCLRPSSPRSSSTTPTTTFTDKVTSPRTSTTSITSKTSSEMDPTADKITEDENKKTKLSNLEVAAVGIASFLAGILATALFLWLFKLKQTSASCFRKPEKTQQRMTSEKRTKMVLAKHMTLEKKDSHATENTVYFTNESTNKQPRNTTGMYEDNGAVNVYTTITTSGINPSAPQIEEHVYKDLDLVRQTDDNENRLKEIDKKEKAGINMDTAYLTVGGNSGADVFDTTRDSAVSNHDYFILQNENFRNSVKTDRVSMPIGAEDSNNEKVENDYFVLEKQQVFPK